MIQRIKKTELDTSENNRENLIIEDKSLNKPKDNQSKTEGQSNAEILSRLYEGDSEKLERFLLLETNLLCSKSAGRKYITVRNIPLGADPKRLRERFNRLFPIVSMGVVKVSNMGSILLYLQPRKEVNIEVVYRLIKANEDLLN